jgi:hypothetical protein
MFDERLQNKILLENSDLTYSRRYFWAYQTTGIMKDSINAIIDAYKDTFVDEIWEGKHKMIWPIVEERSSRNQYWMERMQFLKKDYEKVVKALQELYEDFDHKMRDIRKC